MSDYSVVAQVSQVLRRILAEAFIKDPVINQFITNDSEIVFDNPTQTAQNTANKLSLWLYQINGNEFVKSQPMMAGTQNDTLRVPPLALNLYYLLTPFGPAGVADHLILGGELWRNSLVEHEIGEIERVNHWLENGTIVKGGRFKHIAIKRIPMTLDLEKGAVFVNTRAFIRKMMAYGYASARSLYQAKASRDTAATPAKVAA